MGRVGIGTLLGATVGALVVAPPLIPIGIIFGAMLGTNIDLLIPHSTDRSPNPQIERDDNSHDRSGPSSSGY